MVGIVAMLIEDDTLDSIGVLNLPVLDGHIKISSHDDS